MKQAFIVMPNESEPKAPHELFNLFLNAVHRGNDIASFGIDGRYMFIINSELTRDEIEFLVDCKTCRLGEVERIDGRVLDMARHIARYVVSGGEYIV